MEGFGLGFGGDRELLRLLDWFRPAACPLHDTSKALEWFRRFADAELLDALRIVMCSLRTSCSLICLKLLLFIAMHLKRGEAVRSPDEIRRFLQWASRPTCLR